MNITAKIKRVALISGATLSALFLVACSSTAPGSISYSSSDTTTPEEMNENAAFEEAFGEEGNNLGETASGDLAMVPPTLNYDSRILVPAAGNKLGIELLAGEEFTRMVVHTEGQDLDYRISRLNQPTRLVLDVIGAQGVTTKSFDTGDVAFIDRIRLGAHPDKSRIVLDLEDNSSILHNVDTQQGDIVLTLAPEQSMDNVLAALDSNAVARTQLALNDPSETAIPTTGSSNTAPVIEPVDDAIQPSFDESEMMARPDNMAFDDPSGDLAIQDDAASMNEAVVPVADTENKNLGAENADQGPALIGLRMEKKGSTNSVVAQMESAGFFTLEKTAPSEYVLTLEGATFDAQRVQPILAPAGAGGIRSVRPVGKGNDTLLRIFADPSAELKARVSQGNIIIEPRSGADVYADSEIRAQLGEEGGEAGEGDEAASPVVEVTESSNNNDIDAELSALLEEAPKYKGRLISLDLQDTDIDNALRIIAEVSNLNIIASDDVTGKVTLRLIDVPWDQALDVILKTNGLDKVLEGNVMRIAPVEKLRLEREALKKAIEAEEELEPLAVKYLRISYAKASELQPLVETVISERGTVAYDERTNQLIVKDIARGVKNVVKLVKKLDLRTPQVLLETQIVEAQRTLLRELGAEVGFSHIQSPETGNATGYNFPNSIVVGGSVTGADGVGSSFPAGGDSLAGSAISILLGSADGRYALDTRLSALEREGRVRIVSRPAVATTNNQPATIKSVEKIRVKTPAGGLSVATGSGASASGSGGVATETIEIGIILEVTPQASPDYYVLLDINAKSSTLGATEVDGIPSEVERSATSTVLVSSGQTFAMGGIYKINDSTLVSGVPFLKDIPVLGHLFRFQGVDNSDEELIFFITPRIVEGSFDDAAMRVAS